MTDWLPTAENPARVLVGDALEVLRKLPDGCVHCVATSPPYWSLRDYGVEGQIGLEPTPEAFVARLVEVFEEVRRVLHPSGTCWVNMGDSYANDGKWGGSSGGKHVPELHGQSGIGRTKRLSGLKAKDLCGVPWRLAFALQAAGWWLRSDIIWCLSGGTWLYVRTQKGDMPMTVRDVARLDPATVQLWNGDKWTRLLGMNRSDRTGEELEIVLRSGERISCTPTHKFPLAGGGLMEAGQLRPGHCLTSCPLPEPEQPKCPDHIGADAAWFAGLYLAEGCGVDAGKIQLAGHSRETARWERVQRVAKAYGGSCTLTVNGNNQTIRVYGKVICAVVSELVTGRTAKDKGIAPVVWKYGNDFLRAYLEGYLSGDGHRDDGNRRWRIGFARNYNLERDLRTACARLGWTLTLNPSTAECDGQTFPTFRGEIRETRSGHHNERDRNEIVEIRKARCREVYDLGVEDEPHLFALASGILTHNSKPSPMPESVTDRPTKSHEYIFLLTKNARYFYDAEAVKEESVGSEKSWRFAAGWATNGDHTPAGWNQGDRAAKLAERPADGAVMGTRNKRSVWTIASEPYPEAHFATFPPALVEPMILAGSSAKGVCPACGEPWRRVTTTEKLKRHRPNDLTKRTGENGTGNHCPNTVAGVKTTTTGWEPGCKCGREDVAPALILDPFAGSGTTLAVAVKLKRRALGIELNPDYAALAEKRLAEPLGTGGLFDTGEPVVATLYPDPE